MRLHGVRRPMGRTLARSAAVVSAVRRGEPAREATCDVTNELTGGALHVAACSVLVFIRTSAASRAW